MKQNRISFWTFSRQPNEYKNWISNQNAHAMNEKTNKIQCLIPTIPNSINSENLKYTHPKKTKPKNTIEKSHFLCCSKQSRSFFLLMITIQLQFMRFRELNERMRRWNNRNFRDGISNECQNRKDKKWERGTQETYV